MRTIHNQENHQITFLDERYYTHDNITFYPSVTTILDVYPKGFGFTQWLKDLGSNADEVVKRASNTGSKVHDMIDIYLSGEKISWVNEAGETLYTLEEWLMFLKFVEFYNTYKPSIIIHEESLLDEKLGFGGTLDLVCRIENQTWLIDYKTGNGHYKSHELQISAYRKLWNKINPKNQIERVGIFYLKSTTRGEDKSGKTIQGKGWKLYEPEQTLDYLDSLFQHTFAIWKEENPEIKPKNEVYPDFAQIESKGKGGE